MYITLHLIWFCLGAHYIPICVNRTWCNSYYYKSSRYPKQLYQFSNKNTFSFFSIHNNNIFVAAPHLLKYSDWVLENPHAHCALCYFFVLVFVRCYSQLKLLDSFFVILWKTKDTHRTLLQNTMQFNRSDLIVNNVQWFEKKIKIIR